VARTDQGSGGRARMAEAVLVLVALVLLSPLLLVLLVAKVLRMKAGWGRPDPEGDGTSATWGLFVQA